MGLSIKEFNLYILHAGITQNYIRKAVVGNPVRIRNCPATVEGVLRLQAFHKGAAGRGTESECHLLSMKLA